MMEVLELIKANYEDFAFIFVEDGEIQIIGELTTEQILIVIDILNQHIIEDISLN